MAPRYMSALTLASARARLCGTQGGPGRATRPEKARDQDPRRSHDHGAARGSGAHCRCGVRATKASWVCPGRALVRIWADAGANPATCSEHPSHGDQQGYPGARGLGEGALSGMASRCYVAFRHHRHSRHDAPDWRRLSRSASEERWLGAVSSLVAGTSRLTGRACQEAPPHRSHEPDQAHPHRLASPGGLTPPTREIDALPTSANYHDAWSWRCGAGKPCEGSSWTVRAMPRRAGALCRAETATVSSCST